MYCLGTPWRPLETLLSLEVQWKVEKANYLDSDAGSGKVLVVKDMLYIYESWGISTMNASLSTIEIIFLTADDL